MNREELLRFLDADDLHGLMLFTIRAWLKRDHPGVDYACLVGEFGPGMPTLQIPLTNEDESEITGEDRVDSFSAGF